MKLEKGSILGHYEIVSKIGAGGMGEVYRAQDTKLDRKVAIKVLPGDVANDQDRLRRFTQEARAAAAFNHPNIAHIYEIGESDGTHFIAMELVEGVSLDVKVGGAPLTVSEIVGIGSQIADALDEAHSHGIVHRDIKSVNVMLDRRGRVKVLDFGLAKIAQSVESEDATAMKTRSGVVMGTASYMSPEQALGRVTDARTDLWSLGVILYEMATGRLPFLGESLTETIDKITHAQPDAIARFNYDVPPELEIIIKKALRKAADERYQTARDMRTDLKALSRELDIAEHSIAPVSRSESVAEVPEKAATDPLNTRTLIQHHTTEASGAKSQTTSSAEYLVNGLKGHKLLVAGVAIFLLLAIGGVFGIYKYASGSAKKEFSLADAKITKLTTSGKASAVAISPDGKYVVHVQNNGGQQSLLMRQVATQSNVEIVPPASDQFFMQLHFSLDGNYVYYSVIGNKFPNSALFQVPTLGGEPKKILEGVNYGHISFSPEGTRFAFTRKVSEAVFQLRTANADGTGEQELFESKAPDFINNVAWSPDGKTIVCETDKSTGVGSTLLEVNVANGATRHLTDKKWAGISDMTWSAGGGGLLMLASDKPGPFQIWQVSYPDGAAKQLSNEPDGFGAAFSQTPDSSTLAVVKTTRNASIWVAPVSDLNSARPITSGSGKRDTSPTWLPDGRIVFSSYSGGNWEMWSMTSDGGSLKQIRSSPEAEFDPVISPDGKSIVFSKFRRIWRINVDGTGATQITKGDSELEDFPTGYSPDGKWLFFTQRGANDPISWKLALDGSSDAVKISDKSTYGGWVSPNGKQIAFSYIEKEGAPFRSAIASIDGGEPTKTFPLADTSATGTIRWTPEGRSLVYADWSKNGVGNLVAQPISGGEVKKLTDFKSELIFNFDYSRDGKEIALARGTSASNVLLYTNIK